ncbi:unnamed protein product [Closterium sp. NIES-53]
MRWWEQPLSSSNAIGFACTGGATAWKSSPASGTPTTEHDAAPVASALPLELSASFIDDVFFDDLCGLFCLVQCLVLDDVAGEGVLIEVLTHAEHHHHPLHEVVAARQALDDVGDVGRRRVFDARHPHLSQDPSSTVAVFRH